MLATPLQGFVPQVHAQDSTPPAPPEWGGRGLSALSPNLSFQAKRRRATLTL
jgi:hypothetical protein